MIIKLFKTEENTNLRNIANIKSYYFFVNNFESAIQMQKQYYLYMYIEN